MSYKIMVIDDNRTDREKHYYNVFNSEDFEIIYVWRYHDLHNSMIIPVDAYLVDVFLDFQEVSKTAAEVLSEILECIPRRSPIFLVSMKWGDEQALNVLKHVNSLPYYVAQYFSWSEFVFNNLDDNISQRRLTALRSKILLELQLWHGRCGFRPKQDETIRLLLLSDLQFGDPSTDPESLFSEHMIARALKRDNRIPDLIVFAGDITFSGSPEEFSLAGERIELDLMGPLWGLNNIDNRRDRIILTPGNHDVNLRFSACKSRDYNLKKMEMEQAKSSSFVQTSRKYLTYDDYAIDPFKKFAFCLTRDRNWDIYDDLYWVDRRYLHCGLRFFMLNSVYGLNSSQPEHAMFKESSLIDINRSLFQENLDSIFSIALSHHGLRPLGTESKEREIANWNSSVQQFFVCNNIQLWLYGHYHKFECRTIDSSPFDTNNLYAIQSPTSKIKHTNRGFAIVELVREGGFVVSANVMSYTLGSGLPKIDRNKTIIFESS